MIKNERQYRITRAQASRLRKSLNAANGNVEGGGVGSVSDLASGVVREARSPYGEVHPLSEKARQEAIGSQLADLEGELAEYETLKSGEFDLDALQAVADIPKLLIMARIAMGLTQRELAERIGVKEQQIQRYEATDYAQASLARIREVAAAYRVGP